MVSGPQNYGSKDLRIRSLRPIWLHFQNSKIPLSPKQSDKNTFLCKSLLRTPNITLSRSCFLGHPISCVFEHLFIPFVCMCTTHKCMLTPYRYVISLQIKCSVALVCEQWSWSSCHVVYLEGFNTFWIHLNINYLTLLSHFSLMFKLSSVFSTINIF